MKYLGGSRFCIFSLSSEYLLCSTRKLYSVTFCCIYTKRTLRCEVRHKPCFRSVFWIEVPLIARGTGIHFQNCIETTSHTTSDIHDTGDSREKKPIGGGGWKFHKCIECCKENWEGYWNKIHLVANFKNIGCKRESRETQMEKVLGPQIEESFQNAKERFQIALYTKRNSFGALDIWRLDSGKREGRQEEIRLDQTSVKCNIWISNLNQWCVLRNKNKKKLIRIESRIQYNIFICLIRHDNCTENIYYKRLTKLQNKIQKSIDEIST